MGGNWLGLQAISQRYLALILFDSLFFGFRTHAPHNDAHTPKLFVYDTHKYIWFIIVLKSSQTAAAYEKLQSYLIASKL